MFKNIQTLSFTPISVNKVGVFFSPVLRNFILQVLPGGVKLTLEATMDRKCYSYEKEKLIEGKIPVKCLGQNGEVFSEIAHIMIERIEENNRKGEKTVFILPVGPVGQYPIFVRLVKERGVSLKNCWFFNMDEYLTDEKKYIDISSPLSFRGFMEKNVYSLIPDELNIPYNQRFFPDPDNPGFIGKKIEELGGVDICFGGIGINGHLAFNEAEDVSSLEFKGRDTRVLSISRETRCANAIGDLSGAIDAMPKWAVTIGMKEIYESRKVVLGVFREWHRAVLRRALFDTPSGLFPVTLLQEHSDALILASETASGKAF